MARRSKNYTPEYKSRAIELCLRAIKLNWSVRKFSRFSGIWQTTMLTWLQDDLVFDRYKRAMEQKALEFPTMHMDLIRRVIDGRRVWDKEKQEYRIEYLDPKAARVAMQGLEFRMMREVKRIYATETTVKHKHSLEDMSDQEIEQRKAELIAKEMARAQKNPDEDSPGPTIN